MKAVKLVYMYEKECMLDTKKYLWMANEATGH